MESKIAAQTETEKAVQAIWMEVLETSDIGVRDHFIDLGGNSMAAMLCIFRIKRLFGVQFGIEDFFLDQATIGDLSQLIDENLAHN